MKTFTIPMHDVDRAIADGEEEGFVKIHVKERTDRILGATIVARHAGEMINEITAGDGRGDRSAHAGPRHPRVSDPGRSDQEGGGRLQPHAPDADDRSRCCAAGWRGDRRDDHKEIPWSSA